MRKSVTMAIDSFTKLCSKRSMVLQWRPNFHEKMANFDFKAISCNGPSPPKVTFHTCSVVQYKLYIFGGLDDKKCVQNGLFCFDTSCNEWTELSPLTGVGSEASSKVGRFGAIRIREAPKLSHHTANVIDERLLVFLGGWTGHERSSNAYYYDTTENAWYQIKTKGDIPAGLSSHTSTLVSANELLIIGREGGVRTQRRSGDAFYFNIRTGVYKEAQIPVSSRSGHNANLVKTHLGKNYVLFVQGGRKDDNYQLIGSWNKMAKQGTVLGNDKIADSLAQKWIECDKPTGRQHCASVELSDRYLLFFGGETWRGVRNNVTNEVYILDGCKMKWYRPGQVRGAVPCLTGHTMCMVGDKVYIFGGLLDGKCSNGIWMVNF